MDKNLKIAILLSAVDKASAVIGKAFSNAEKHAKAADRVAKATSSIGNSSLVAGGAVTAFFAKTVADARESEIAQKKLITGFQTMGSTAEQAKKMIAFAGNQEYNWGVSDENIMDVMGKLSTYKRTMTDAAIANNVFQRATQASFDLAAKGFGDAMGNANSLGKALQNPALQAGALTKTGTLNKEDVTAIRRLQRAKGIAAAQEYILKTVEKQAKGAAEATADPVERIKIAAGEVSETIGGKLLPTVNKYTKLIMANKDRIFAWLDSHSALIKRVAAAGVALLAFGGIMKGVSFVFSGFSTAYKIAGTVAKGGQFIRGLTGFGSEALAAGEKLNKFQTIGLNTLSKMKTMGTGISSAMDSVSGAIGKAGSFLMANPIYLIIAAIAVAAFLIIKYWKPISAFFVNLWNKVKEPVMKFWGWIKPYLLNFTPIGLIIKYWKPLSNFFVSIWDKVKNVFVSAFNWINNLAGRFWQAGVNIVKSVWEGMKTLAHKPVELIADITKKMREYLPFSPAKAGAFRDLHRVKIVETMVKNMQPGPAVRAMSQVTERMLGQAQTRVPVHSSGGGAQTVSFNINVNLSGRATKEDARVLTSELKGELNKWYRDMMTNKSRVSFS